MVKQFEVTSGSGHGYLTLGHILVISLAHGASRYSAPALVERTRNPTARSSPSRPDKFLLSMDCAVKARTPPDIGPILFVVFSLA